MALERFATEQLEQKKRELKRSSFDDDFPRSRLTMISDWIRRWKNDGGTHNLTELDMLVTLIRIADESLRMG